MTMPVKINPSGGKPVYRQIMDQLIRHIERHTLKPGETAPPSRSLAAQLGVNRATVYRAYAELQALGYLESRPGSYNVVRSRNQTPNQPKSTHIRDRWKNFVTPVSDQLYHNGLRNDPENTLPEPKEKTIIDMSRLQSDPRLYPMADFRRCLNHALVNGGHEALNYGHQQGYAPLRDVIARRLRKHGITVTPDEILVTNGAQQAIDLIGRVMDSRRQSVAVETPTYSSVIPLFRLNGFTLLNIPMSPDGMDLAALERHLAKSRVCFVYTMPNFQNPMGITTSHGHREQLLRLCVKYDTPVVEDGFEEEMKYYGKVPMPIKSMDTGHSVIYIGTFSKALFAGLRIGWIAADRALIDRLVAVRRITDLSGSQLTQRALDVFCRKGYYDRHLKRLHRAFRKRMNLALSAMSKYFPEPVTWTKPLGGYTIWVQLPRKISEDQLLHHTVRHGVRVTHGKYFFTDSLRSEHFRICIAPLNENEIASGIKRLGRALKEMI